jgi:hypothetical protein
MYLIWIQWVYGLVQKVSKKTFLIIYEKNKDLSLKIQIVFHEKI